VYPGVQYIIPYSFSGFATPMLYESNGARDKNKKYQLVLSATTWRIGQGKSGEMIRESGRDELNLKEKK
jgi:hypothetical protein